MEKLIRQSWWKWVGVALLIYVFAAGLLIPLKPNVPRVDFRQSAGSNELHVEVQGYNTRFDQQAETTRAWLCMSDSLRPYIAARQIEILNARRAILSFELPDAMPTDDEVVNLSLLIDGPVDGVYVRPDAVQLDNPSRNQPSDTGWTYDRIPDLHRLDQMTFPARRILEETIRNTYFHVAIWLAMMLLFIGAAVYALRYLIWQRKRESGQAVEVGLPQVSGLSGSGGLTSGERADLMSVAFTEAGLLLGLLGLATGFLWARYTWGSWWSGDVKQYATLVALLIYAAYFMLRSSMTDGERRARVGAAYNLFAFAMLIPLIYILPRVAGNSLHPGNAGNPAFGSQDLDGTMRMVFYPAVIGWALLGYWLASIRYRISCLEKDETFDI